MLTQPGQDITWGELHVGTRSMFPAAGFEKVRAADATPRRDAHRLQPFEGLVAATIRDLIAAAVDKFGRLDVLVNNSGGPPLAYARTCDARSSGPPPCSARCSSSRAWRGRRCRI